MADEVVPAAAPPAAPPAPPAPAANPPAPAANPPAPAPAPKAPDAPAPKPGDAPAPAGVPKPGEGRRSLLAEDPAPVPKPGDAPAPPAPKAGDPPAAKTPEQIAAEAAALEEAKPWVLAKPDWLPKEDADAFEAWGRAENLTKAQTQKFLDQQAGRQVETYNRLFQIYDDQITADPEFGGAKKAETLANAKRALKFLATPAERAVLDTAPEGSHPILLRILARAGARMNEDGFVAGHQPQGDQPKTAAAVQYGPDGGAKPSTWK